MKFERSISNIKRLRNYKSANFDVKDIAKDLVSKLPNPSNKYGVLSVSQYYSHYYSQYYRLTKKSDLLAKLCN